MRMTGTGMRALQGAKPWCAGGRAGEPGEGAEGDDVMRQVPCFFVPVQWWCWGNPAKLSSLESLLLSNNTISDMASFLRGKQSGVQNDLSAAVVPGLFSPAEQSRFGINSQIRFVLGLLGMGTDLVVEAENRVNGLTMGMTTAALPTTPSSPSSPSAPTSPNMAPARSTSLASSACTSGSPPRGPRPSSS